MQVFIFQFYWFSNNINQIKPSRNKLILTGFRKLIRLFFLKLKCVHQLLSLPSISCHKTCWNFNNLICFSDHLIWSNEKKILETILIIFSTEITATFPAHLLNRDEEDEHDYSTQQRCCFGKNEHFYFSLWTFNI